MRPRVGIYKEGVERVKVCACGCGEVFQDQTWRARQKYVAPPHGQRLWRRRQALRRRLFA